MARDYTLNMKKPPKLGDPKHDLGWDEVEREIEENIPMVRAVGDHIRIIIKDNGYTTNTEGTIRQTKRGKSLVEGPQGRWFVEDGLKFTEVEPTPCDLCLEFPCQCHSENQNTKHQTDNTMSEEHKPIPFATLAAKEDGDKVSCVQGILTRLRDVFEGDSKHGHWAIQGGELTDDDGDVHDILFTGDDAESHPIQPKKMWKKKIRITGVPATKGKGMVGITMQEKEYKGKIERALKIDNRAIIEIIKADGSAEQRDNTSEPAAERPAREAPTQRTMKQTPVEGSQATFEHRLNEWVKAYHKTCSRFGVTPAPGEDAFKDIAFLTDKLVYSFKGQYGVYADILWEEGGDKDTWGGSDVYGTSPQSTEKDTSDDLVVLEKPKPAAKPKSKAPGWKEFIHPNKKIPLGDLEDADLRKACVWAITKTDKDGKSTIDPAKGELVKTQINLLAAIEEKGYNATELLEKQIMDQEGYNNTFDDDDLSAYVKGAYDCSVQKITQEQARQMLCEFKGMLEEMEINHKKKASEDDGSDLPA